MSKINISAPWYAYHKKVKEFFGYDPDIEVGELEESGEGCYTINIFTKNPEKAYALQGVLKRRICFGGVIVNVNSVLKDCNIVETAFAGNIAVRDIRSKEILGESVAYVRLEPEIIQFYNDDTSTYDGKTTLLLQDIAREIFALPMQTYICTVDRREDS